MIARLYPDIQLSVLHSNDPVPTVDALRRDAADILILPGALLGEHFMEHHRWSDHYTLAVARDRQGAPRNFADLARRTRYVAWRHPGLDRLHGQLAAAQARLSQRGELSCVDTLLDLVAKGHCMSILPSTLLSGHHKELEQLPLPVSVPRHVSVVARPTSLISSAANVVIQALRKPPLMAVQRC